MKLVHYTKPPIIAIENFRNIFLERNEKIAGGFLLERTTDIKQWLKIEKENQEGKLDFTPASTYFYYDEENCKIVGIISIRHNINDENLAKYYGHVGYSVHPEYRKRGYATAMLGLLLPECKKFGLDKLLITCLEGNIGSYKTIEANGGKFESTVKTPEGNIYKRYWIYL